jgi:hypothetical protein
MSKIFNVTSGKMVCSDPCYTLDTWCLGVIDNVKNGKWEADIANSNQGDWGDRISHLWVFNVDAVIDNPKLRRDIETFKGHTLPFSFGVDSGQFGFFDFANYRNDESAKDLKKYEFGDDFDRQEGDEWYRVCADLTLGKDSWGVLPNGAVSSSGFGDGSYEVRGIKDNNGEYVAFCVEYIGQEDEDDEVDDWGDEDEDNDNN